MIPRFPVPSAEVVARVRAFSERRLSAEEFDAYVNAPMSDDERQAILELFDWFCRRYPGPLDRLIAARRAYKRAALRNPQR
jgi:hypothetical protein